MFYELLAGLRYTRSRKRAQGRNRLISFVSLISIIGIALGVTTLIVVLSVMNGFQEQIRDGLLSVVSHIEVEAVREEAVGDWEELCNRTYETPSLDSYGLVSNWQQISEEAIQHAEVTAAAPYVSGQGMLMLDKTMHGVQVRGIIPELESAVADFGKNMRVGSLNNLQSGGFGVVIGRRLARMLDAKPGSKLTLFAPQSMVTPAAVMPRMRQFEVVGIFEIKDDAFHFDPLLVFIHLADAQALYRTDDAVSGVRLRLKNLFSAPFVSCDLTKKISTPNLVLRDWTRMNAEFFKAIAMEKTMLMLFLLLIVTVAAFNIVASLTMTVQEKAADIAILRTLGASPLSIMTIFTIQGSIIGVIGLVAGLAGGLSIVYNLDVIIPAIERIAGETFWHNEVYGIFKSLPVKVLVSDIVIILAVSFLLTLTASIYPSWRASCVKPAEALRYE